MHGYSAANATGTHTRAQPSQYVAMTASSAAPSPVAYLGDPSDSPWTESLKTSPRTDVPTFNLHTTSISTVYQSDADEDQTSPNGYLPRVAQGGPTALGSFDQEFDMSAAPNCESQGATLETRLVRVERGIKANEELNKLVQEFCSIGADYAARMQALADRIPGTFTGESSTAAAAMSSFRSYVLKLAANQNEFVEAVAHECVIPQTTAQRLSTVKREAQSAREEHDSAEAERAVIAAEVEDMYLQSKAAMTMCSQAFHEPPSMKTRLHAGLIPLFLKFMQKSAELGCHRSDGASAALEAENARLSGALRELDAVRLADMRDCMSKFVVYETARLRNLQYDMSQLVEVLNGVDHELDWTAFEKEGYRELTDATSSAGRVARRYASYLKTAIPEVFRSYAVSQLALSAPKERVLRRIERKLSKYVDAVWSGSEGDVVMSDFVGEMQSSLVRQVFCNLIATSALRCNKLPSMSALKLLARFVGTLLSFAQRQSDVWCGFAVLKLSDFVHAVDDSDPQQLQRCPLRLQIYSHEYWSRIPFWEECLTIAIAQDFAALFEDLRPDSALLPVTPELRGFRQWMTGFGINYLEAQALIGRVCGRLGLPEDYTHCLLSDARRGSR
ncbi:uncharacterized protein BcabD6B2_05410 [Babesia caballi]|uniref:FCH domain-containing protein n=1 Tax=Babesia caballi TaxID=5871 RepID=A0AAV4LPR1_BABCB|nr:hypothetical protein, conserved [Babesia caballi]